MADKQLLVTPKGMRWPWYPCFRSRAEFVHSGTTGDDGTMAPHVDVQITEPVVKGRVGLRLWAKNIGKSGGIDGRG